MHRAHRPADIDTNECRFTRTQRTLRIEKVRKRPALYEVAPEPDPPVVAVHAINRHDVGVSHPCDRSRFAEQRAGFVLSVETSGQEKFQREVALERRVECTIDLAERASPHSLQAFEGAPTVQRPWRRAVGRRSRFELGFVQSSLPVLHGIVKV